jgi:hypothetical protein
MTLAVLSRRVEYTGTGTTGPFAFSFTKVAAAAHLRVYKDLALLTLTADYTVTLAADGSGSVTTVAAVAVGAKLVIVHEPPVEQQQDLDSTLPFQAETVETMVDRAVTVLQRLKDRADRGLGYADGLTGSLATLVLGEAPVSGRALKWDGAQFVNSASDLDDVAAAAAVSAAAASASAGSASGSATAAGSSATAAALSAAAAALSATLLPPSSGLAANDVLRWNGSQYAAVPVAASRLVGRGAAGDVTALDASAARTVLGLATSNTPTFAGLSLTGSITTPSGSLTIGSFSGNVAIGSGASAGLNLTNRGGFSQPLLYSQAAHDCRVFANGGDQFRIEPAASPTACITVTGSTTNPVAGTTAGHFVIDPASTNTLVINGLPTASAGLPTGALWNDSGTIKVA